MVTDANGNYAVALPPGPYTIEPQPVEGSCASPSQSPVTVGDGVVERRHRVRHRDPLTQGNEPRPRRDAAQ